MGAVPNMTLRGKIKPEYLDKSDRPNSACVLDFGAVSKAGSMDVRVACVQIGRDKQGAFTKFIGIHVDKVGSFLDWTDDEVADNLLRDCLQ